MDPTQPTHINIALHAKTHTQRLKTGRIQRATSREKARPAETEEAHSKRLDAVKASQALARAAETSDVRRKCLEASKTSKTKALVSETGEERRKRL